MDQQLEQRFRTLSNDPDTPEAVITFVRDELDGVDPQRLLRDDEAGGFVTHVVLALTRLVHDEDPISEPSDGVLGQVISEQPQVRAEAHDMAERIKTKFGRELPHTETQFLIIHLGLLARHLAEH